MTRGMEKAMQTDEFRQVGEDLFGNGWQTRMARALGVDGSTVRRWVGGAIPVPPQIAAYLDVLGDRQETRGALILERQHLGNPAGRAADVGTIEYMTKRLVFSGVDQAKPMPAIIARVDGDIVTISMDGSETDEIGMVSLSYALTRHPDTRHLRGYVDAARGMGHSVAVTRQRFHHYTLVAHDTGRDHAVIHQISTHAGQVRTLWSTPASPMLVVESTLA